MVLSIMAYSLSASAANISNIFFQTPLLAQRENRVWVFIGSPKLAALVVTEINPDHDPDGLLVRRFVDAFADALRPVAANAPRR